MTSMRDSSRVYRSQYHSIRLLINWFVLEKDKYIYKTGLEILDSMDLTLWNTTHYIGLVLCMLVETFLHFLRSNIRSVFTAWIKWWITLEALLCVDMSWPCIKALISLKAFSTNSHRLDSFFFVCLDSQKDSHAHRVRERILLWLHLHATAEIGAGVDRLLNDPSPKRNSSEMHGHS